MSKTILIKAKMLPVPYLCNDADAVHWKNLWKGQSNKYTDRELKDSVIKGWLFKYKAFYKETEGEEEEEPVVPPVDPDPIPPTPDPEPDTDPDYVNPDADYGTGNDNTGTGTTSTTDQVSDQDETLSNEPGE